MNTTDKSTWTRKFTEIIDQRDFRIPPLWCKRKSSKAHHDYGDDLFISGKERKMANAVISLLEEAQEKAIISAFLLADKGIEDAILEAEKRGVRVYVLLASEIRLKQEGSDGEFDQKTFKQHKAMLNRLEGRALFRSAEHFHAKAAIIDPERNPQGILLTANLTSEALERNEELAVRLTAEEVREAIGYLKWAMWESAEHELINQGDFKAVKPLGKVPHPKPTKNVLATTEKSHSIKEQMLTLISNAQREIIVSSFGWDKDHEVVRALLDRASKEGIKVSILGRIRSKTMPALLALAEAGASVYGFKWLHAKAICIDGGQQAMIMSANLEKYGLDSSFELGVRLDDHRAEFLHKCLRDWETQAPWELYPEPALGEIDGEIIVWMAGEFQNKKVEVSSDLELDNIVADSADDLERPMPPLEKPKGPLPRMAHKLRCHWTVTPPVLHPKAKEYKKPVKKEGLDQKNNKKAAQPQPYNPPVFKQPDGRLVVAIKTPDQIDQARTLMKEIKAQAIVVQRKPSK